MTANQLRNSLDNLHTDYHDTDLIVMFVDKNGVVGYQLLAYLGIVLTKDSSIPVIGTKEAALKMTEEGLAKMINTGLPPTEKDLNPDINETE